MNAVLNRLSIRNKLGLIGLMMVVGMAFMMTVAIWNLYTNLLEDRHNKTQVLVETATDVVGYFHSQMEQGRMTEAEAQQQALAALKAMHYEGDGYYWVNDTSYTMLYHPKSKLIGQNISGIKDPNGKQLFVDMVQLVNRQGAGFVDYQWSKPGYDEPVDKASYVQLFKPWNWVIGTGIYIDDVQTLLWHDIRMLGSVALLGFLLISAVSLAISRNIYRPLQMMSDVMQRMNATNDLTLTLKTQNRDELGEISTVFNEMVHHFRDVLAEVSNSSSRLTSQSEELSAVTVQTTASISQQQSDITQVSSASFEMNEATSEVAHNAQNTLSASRSASEEMGHCVSTLNRNIDTINQLGQQIETSATRTDTLKDASNSIGDIVAVIREIADQTNLLALNAAIEAARAGEQGRGFAVVADEVRTLAARTQDATQNVEQVIERLQQGVEATVSDMNECQRIADDCVNQAQDAGTSLSEMKRNIDEIANMNSAIGSAAQQQTSTTSELRETLSQIQEISMQNADGSRHTAKASDELAQLAVHLNSLITRFKV